MGPGRRSRAPASVPGLLGLWLGRGGSFSTWVLPDQSLGLPCCQGGRGVGLSLVPSAIRLMPPPPSPTGTAAGALHLPGTTTTMYAIANPWTWPASFTVEARLFVRSGSSDPYWLSYASPGNSNCFVSRAPGTLHQWLTVHITYSGGTTRYVCGTAGRASRTPLQPMPPSTPPPQRPHALFGHLGPDVPPASGRVTGSQ